MWEIFQKLCEERGVTSADVSRATGVGQSTLGSWKKRRNLLSAKHAQKIADYFGVSLQYLMTGENPGGDFKGLIDAMVDGLDYYVPVNDTIKVIVQTVSKWRPEQQKRLLKQIEQVDAIIGENS